MPRFVKIYTVCAVLVCLAVYSVWYLASPEVEVRAMSRLQARTVGLPFDRLALPPEIGVLGLEGRSRWYGMRYPHDDRYGRNTNQRACWVSFLVGADGIVQRVDARTRASTRWRCIAAVAHYEEFLDEADPVGIVGRGRHTPWIRIPPPEPDPKVDPVLAGVRAFAVQRSIHELDLPSELVMQTVAEGEDQSWRWVRYERTGESGHEFCEFGFEVDVEGVVKEVQRRPAAERLAICAEAGQRLAMAWHSDERWYVPGSPATPPPSKHATNAGR